MHYEGLEKLVLRLREQLTELRSLLTCADQRLGEQSQKVEQTAARLTEQAGQIEQNGSALAAQEERITEAEKKLTAQVECLPAGIKIRTGTKTVAASGNGSYHTLFTSAQLNTLFGTTGVTYDASNTTVVAVNGGYTDVQKIFAMAYSSSTGVWYVRTADGSTFPAANLTVNYIVTTW